MLFLAATAALGDSGIEGAPAAAVPRDMMRAWLRFHETELCQDLDAVFAFGKHGVEVWVAVSDEGTFQKLTRLFSPLRRSFEVEIYATRNPPEKKTAEERGPPPSLWNNEELRLVLGDSLSHGAADLTIVRGLEGAAMGESDSAFKRRLTAFAEQTLAWNLNMRRYAVDLPALAAAGFGGGATADLRASAARACKEHAQGIDKMAEQLSVNLARALPKASKRTRSKPQDSREPRPRIDPIAAAARLAANAQGVSRRIYRFIYPQDHTVGLVDLREPDLLEALRNVRDDAARLLATAGSIKP